MRYYHPASDRVLQLRNPRLRFFLFGPFYLAWLRLWLEAAITAIGVWIVVHGTVVYTAWGIGGSRRLDLRAALDLVSRISAAPRTGESTDALFRELVTLLLPFYTGAFILLLVAALLTFRLTRYLDWRYRRRGYVALHVEEEERDGPDDL